MNKQRYLAELQRLLVFMTDEDREETIRRYSELFDAAGPDNETTLVSRIGSPTKAAIGLSRGYTPGKLPEKLPGMEEAPKQKASLTQDQDDPWGDLPTFDLPEHIEEMISEEEAEKAASEEDAKFTMPDLPGYAGRGASDAETASVRGMPLWLGIPLFVIVILGLGVPFAALCLALTLALLVPGGGIIFCAYLAVIGGLWCISFMADAILLFGTAFIILAFGIILLFVGIWIGVKLWSLFIRCVRWVAGELLGRKVA